MTPTKSERAVSIVDVCGLGIDNTLNYSLSCVQLKIAVGYG